MYVCIYHIRIYLHKFGAWFLDLLAVLLTPRTPHPKPSPCTVSRTVSHCLPHCLALSPALSRTVSRIVSHCLPHCLALSPSLSRPGLLSYPFPFQITLNQYGKITLNQYGHTALNQYGPLVTTGPTTGTFSQYRANYRYT